MHDFLVSFHTNTNRSNNNMYMYIHYISTVSSAFVVEGADNNIKNCIGKHLKLTLHLYTYITISWISTFTDLCSRSYLLFLHTPAPPPPHHCIHLQAYWPLNQFSCALLLEGRPSRFRKATYLAKKTGHITLAESTIAINRVYIEYRDSVCKAVCA